MPYLSQAQRGYFHAAEKRGEISPRAVHEFDSASKGLKLPARKMARGGAVNPKKSLAASIVASMKSKQGEDDGDEGEHADEGQLAASEEMMHALEAKDAKGFASALCAFMDQYETKPHEEAEHDEGEAAE